MLPTNLQYMNKLESAPARQYTAVIQPEGAQSGYQPNSSVKFNIPTTQNTVLVPSETYLRFTLSGITNGANANASIRLDGCGVHGAIQRIRVSHGSTEIENIDNYGMLAKLMMSLQQSSDGFMGKQNMLSGTFRGLFVNQRAGFANPALIGEKLLDTGIERYTGLAGNDGRVPANAVIADRTYAINLISYVGSLAGNQYIPLFEMTSAPLRLEIQWVSSVLKFICNMNGLANSNFVINNLELCCTFIELSDQSIATIRASQMGQPLTYVVQSYQNVAADATLQTASATSINLPVPAKYASLKSIFVTQRRRHNGAVLYFPYASTHFNLNRWRFRIGSQLLPSKAPDTMGEHYAELLKAIGSLSNVDHEPSLNYSLYAQDIDQPDSDETEITLGSDTKSSCFAIGFDCESYANANKDRIFAGMNTLNSDIFFNADYYATGIGNDVSVRFDFFALYDQVLVFENGTLRVVK